MNNERRPTDDLQKGEDDLFVTPIGKTDAEPITDSNPSNFYVWWVDNEGNDRKTKISAETNTKAISIVKAFENCKYVVVCEKIGIFKR